MKSGALQKLREELRKRDRKILKLLNERATFAIEVGQVKTEHSREVYDPSQESRVFTHLADINPGPLSDRAVKNIFREIISSSRAMQASIAVAYLGPEASFTHQAALSHFGCETNFSPKPTIGEVFNAVEREAVRWGVVPVENSLEGSVRQTLNRLIATPAVIRAEIFMKISLCLLSTARSRKKIKRVYSHSHAFAQCREWVQINIPDCSLMEVGSTAEAARRALEDREGAAVASRIAASTYGLHILGEGIEDHPENTTRFLVIGKGESEATGNDKTSILFTTPHVPGALHRALEPFARKKVNMLRIESHPMRDRMWEYLFFVDFAGHASEKKTARVLEEMRERTTLIKRLGSYPRGEQG